MIERKLITQCVREFNGEYSVKGIARILTGYHGFKFIPKLKKSKLYGVCPASEEDAILAELEKMKEEGLIVVKENYKVFTTDLLEVLSDETIEFVKPEFAPREHIPFTPTEDLLHVIYGEGAENELLNDNTKRIISLIEDKNNIFVTGGAGTGKSYILNQLRLHYRNKLHVTSTTGISALNISGQTIHSWAGIGIADKPVDVVVATIRKNPILLKQLLLAELLAIDEISMLDNDTFDYLNDVLKAVRKDKRPFGGIQLLLFGDFFQLPPVGLDEETGIDFCFNSHSWKELNLKTILLEEVKRQSDKEFINALNNVREDKTDVDDMKVFFQCDYDFDYEPPRDILQIFSTNNRADAYNAQCFAEIESEPFEYVSKDELLIYNRDQEAVSINLDSPEADKLSEYDRNCVKRFNEDCKATHVLELKVGCRVMLVKNQNIKAGLVNGSCGTVSNLTKNSITVLFDNGVEVNVSPENFEYIKENRPKVRRRQFPLRLAYGITIHKSQGMTFDKLVVNFNRIFAYGQAYVALSRTRSKEGLIIKGFDPNKIKANPKVIEFYKNLDCIRM